jgi:hypothetical protein
MKNENSKSIIEWDIIMSTMDQNLPKQLKYFTELNTQLATVAQAIFDE